MGKGHIEDRWLRKDRTKRPEHGTGLRWRVIWRDDHGDRTTRSFRNKDAAQNYLTRLEHDDLTGDIVTRDVKDRRLAHYWPTYEKRLGGLSANSQNRYRRAWARIETEYGDQPLRLLRGREIDAWASGLTTERGTPAGVALRKVTLQVLASLIDMAIEDGVTRTNPARKTKARGQQKREHVYLTPAELAQLLEHTPEHWRPLFDFLASTGLRIGEASDLRAADVDTRRWRLNVSRSGHRDTTKTEKSRPVPIPVHLREDITARVKNTQDGDGLLFTTPAGTRIDTNNLRPRVLAPAVKAAKLPDRMVIHDLRHTCASNLIAAGVSVKTVQEILGHASPVITLQVYAGVFDEDLDAAGDAIAARYGRHVDT